jgi:hypothetical protein
MVKNNEVIPDTVAGIDDKLLREMLGCRREGERGREREGGRERERKRERKKQEDQRKIK